MASIARDEAGRTDVEADLDRIDWDDSGRGSVGTVVRGFGLMSRYFLAVGESGAAKLKTDGKLRKPETVRRRIH